MTAQRRERPASLIRAVIMSRIKVEDAETAERLADMIERFALFLMYADSDTKMAVMDTLFSVLPEDIVISVISSYVARIDERYRRVRDIVARLAPRVAGSAEGDLLAAMLREALQSYMQQVRVQPQHEQPRREAAIKELPEELKRLLQE
ncbi:MAG: hypothetical protein LM577_07095 [Thermoproteaceae archaeon]|nr:hypothetical protein [Thermoproteaceae archaeon]